MIPRLIHQTWKTSLVPEKWSSSVQKYRALEAHGFTYKLWTDEDNRALIRDHYPWFLAQFDAYPYGIQRADAIRYFILYHYGGVYSDLDIQPKDRFLEFFQLYENEQVVLPSTKNGNGFANHIYSNCFMMSQPKCDFWPVVWSCLQSPFAHRPWKRILAWAHYWRILFTTGPGVICDAAEQYSGRVAAIPAALIQPGVETDAPLKEYPEAVVELLRGESWQQKDADFWRTMGRATAYGPLILGVLAAVFFLMALLFLWYWRRCLAREVSHVDPSRNTNLFIAQQKKPSENVAFVV